MIKTSYRRPVAIAMVYISVALLGLRAWQDIPIERHPDVSLPQLNINATWPGASPETMEAFLTSPVEASVQLVGGVERIVSQSSEGSASITAEFTRDTDMDFARLDLSERLRAFEETDLPPGARVTVRDYVPVEYRRTSLLQYTFTGALTLGALREHLDEVVVPELSRVEGVAVVQASGGRERILEVEINKESAASLGVSAGEVRNALSRLDLRGVAGAVREGDNEWTVTIHNRPASAQDVRNAIVRNDSDKVVRVSNVATVRDTWEDVTSYYRINSRPAVSMSVVKEAGANAVRVVDAVKERMEVVEARNPPNTRFILDRDGSELIRKEMSDMRSRVFVAAMVIFAVLLIFLRSVRPAVMVFATIAFSVLIALNFIYFAGYTLNQLTLVGLAMGFGLVVDNSIVVLENIYRRWQQGKSREDATLRGASNVVLPIIAATGTNLIVLVPFVYLQDELRLYYLPLAIAVGLSLVGSLLVAFSFIPALAGKLLPELQQGDARLAGARPPLYERFYRSLVTGTLRWPWLTLSVPIAALIASGYIFNKEVDRGFRWGGLGGSDTYINISISLPDGTDIERTEEFTRFFENRLRAMPQVRRFVTNVQPTSSRIHVTFPKEIENTQIPVGIKDQLFAYSLQFSGVDVRVTGYGPSFYGGSGGYSPQYRIQVLGYEYLKVKEIAEGVGSRLERLSRVRDVNTNAALSWRDRERATEFGVVIRRDAVASYDLTVEQLIGEVQAAVRGQTSNDQIKIGGDEIRFQVKVEGNREIDLVEFTERLITTSTGEPVRLGNLVDIEPRDVLSAIHREDQQYERSVGYEFRGPPKLGNTTQETTIRTTATPPGYQVRERESFRITRDEQTQIYLVLGASIILVYMLTAALFESLLLPLCVLLTVPMALIGVFMIFFYTDATFTREAYFGVIIMGGIVVNNAILLVDHINRLRWEEKLALKAAVVRGTVERVRPILMTTTTTILGLLPLVLFTETVNATIWNALAFVLIGGLASSSMLVLTVTPAIYFLIEKTRAARAEVAAAAA
ncbi:MAG: efflux RND transporter permease subunit [Gemmatimonadota bacterium]|nr:efflux RND transporter permease subunit [Gemmatimonadota bacterium]MDE2677920.1 efflux RND transporter permease subunit [Gemmatimonadota bacterium]